MAGNIGLGEPLSAPTDAVVDIVFVHGLGGDRVETWTEDSVFWPKDLLAADIPNARIFSFGYRASIIDFWGTPSQNRIDNHADDLVQQLAGARVETGTTDRPIIMVVHSLGGLVCEQAIRSAENRREEQTKQIAHCVRRIAYFGTPHEGSEKAKWADAARRYIAWAIDSNDSLLEDLEKGSAKLTELGREFPNLLRRRAKTEEEIEVMCFFESKNMKVKGKSIGKVVPEASACLQGYPNLSLYADHRSMCKFEGKDDENYKKVVKHLQAWVKALQQPWKEGGGNSYTAYGNFDGTFYGGIQNAQNVGGELRIDPATYNIGVPAPEKK